MTATILIRTTAAAAVAALLFAAPTALAQDGHGSHAEAGHAHGHQHANFQSDRIHVRVDGAEGGRDIILIPGLSSSPEVWRGTVDHLGAGWRVHRIHIQGFAGAPAEGNAQGATPSPVAAPVAEEIARYIREQGLTKPVVVGHSMGGTIGLMLAARHPDAVGKLMVVDMIPFMGAVFAAPGASNAAIATMADQVYASMADVPRADYDQHATTSLNGMIKTESLRAGPLEDSRTSDQKVSAAAFRELIVTDMRPELARITAPTEVLYVKFNDPRVTPEITDQIFRGSYASLPGVTLKRIDDSAHFIMLDQPQVFYADLDAFLSAK
ncbi:alpha/beta fold hydrolase [Brevundimonas sp. SORGH_AS_0993]|uniref:alpha/beta fold hydrolase n=1 Tax=Brevundimonas sp. SORGH_AS_0993 TaxID=3041794 RepID=UPI002782B472|nr:alpha/beta hydrolase [Brevundimonas sp. SORGH_AS_0993]MDQ1154563.1 pimeloyl-ACP methyl ester carboxylesterase [Brevundimonas sp. SORGH_AS_0993]